MEIAPLLLPLPVLLKKYAVRGLQPVGMPLVDAAKPLLDLAE